MTAQDRTALNTGIYAAIAALLLSMVRGCDVPVPPDPPVPPTPTPTPNPPDPNPPDPTPDPDVDDAPFPADGLTVLIVEETTERRNLSVGHRSVITSVAMREWFDEHDVVWRIYDKDTEGASEPFETALHLPRDSLPWILISNGETGFSGPLPDGVMATIRLIEQYRE